MFKSFLATIALLYPPIVVNSTVALTLSLGGYESAIALLFISSKYWLSYWYRYFFYFDAKFGVISIS